jgi:polyisoprenyl-phosphate glycosyltransferase
MSVPATTHLLEPRPYPQKLSIVMPIYNEAPMIGLLEKAIVGFAAELRCELELILVNDGSQDTSVEQLVDWARRDRRVRVLHLSRNFGHQIAATAGLDHATGDATILMDADLQDPLNVIHRMVEQYCLGYDVVYGQRQQRRGETLFKRVTAWGFYRFMRKFIHPALPLDTGDFRLMSRPCLLGLRQMGETHRFLRGMVTWLGYAQTGVLYERHERAAGITKYPLSKMIRFAWTAATSFSDLPLRVALYFGMLGALITLLIAFRALLAHLLGWFTVSGWTSLMLVVGLSSSLILICLGIIGNYLGNIYIEVKGRPLYLVARQYQFDETPDPGGLEKLH